MELTGKLIKKFPVVSGTSKAGKQWSKIEFVLQLMGKYPEQLKLESMNADVISFVSDTNLNTDLKCQIGVSSREWTPPNGGEPKWFTSARTWSVEKHVSENSVYNADGTQGKQTAFSQPIVAGDDDLPF